MPTPTPESLQQQVDKLRAAIAGKGEGAEAVELRGLKKKLRRAQRKQRRLAAETARVAATVKSGTKAAAAPEAPADEKKDEAPAEEQS